MLQQAILLGVIMALVSACGVSRSADDEDVVVEFREVATQTLAASSGLAGAVVTDSVSVEVRDNPRFIEVRFHVDDPELLEQPDFVADERPYRMDLDTRQLADGTHTITVTAEVTKGRAPVATKEFYVANETNGEVPDEVAEPAEGTEEPGEAVEEGSEGEPRPDEESEESAGDEGDAEAEEEAYEPEEETAEPEAEAPGADLPAATLFAAPNGSGSGDGRSASSPVSVQRAAELVRPGDVVYLRGGVYPIGVRFSKSGSSDRPIVWTSYPGEWAVFDGSGHTPISSSAKFHVAGVSWNVFMNLEVRNGPQEGIYVNGSHDNVFRNIVTHGHQYSGIGNVGSDRNLYEGITAYDNYDDHNPRGLYGDDADGIALSSGDSNVVRKVVAYNNSDDGIDAWRSTNTLIEDVVAYGNGRGSHGNGNGIKAGGNGEWNATVVRNSIAFDNKSNGFDDNSGRGIVFENNTAFRNGGYSFMGGSTTTRRNNIAVGGTVGMWGASDRNNSWNLGISDPRFVSTEYGTAEFLTLAPGSPAIGAGEGGADLGAIAHASSYSDLVGRRVLGAVASLRADALALR